MKKVIVTRADDAIKNMADLTHPFIEKYANKCNADFIQLSKNANCKGNGKFHFRIMELHSILENYDRALSLDSDIIIMPNCPNLFEIVPEDKIGTIFEDKGTRAKDRRQRIKKIQKEFGQIGWEQGYINTGVFLVSKQHKSIFQKINNKYYAGRGFDDVHLGYQINKQKIQVHELSFKFNHMTMFSEEWNGSPNRFDSYIIHYAGNGNFEPKINRETQIKRDIERITNESI